MPNDRVKIEELAQTVGRVLEGWTLPADARKQLEAAYYPACAALSTPTRQAGDGFVKVAQLSVGHYSVDACKLLNKELTDDQARDLLGIGIHDLYATPQAQPAQGGDGEVGNE